jgi:hypothetical protein
MSLRDPLEVSDDHLMSAPEPSGARSAKGSQAVMDRLRGAGQLWAHKRSFLVEMVTSPRVQNIGFFLFVACAICL